MPDTASISIDGEVVAHVNPEDLLLILRAAHTHLADSLYTRPITLEIAAQLQRVVSETIIEQERIS